MPKDKPRYLMGVGTPSNIIEGVARGVDFFDCVMPARNARHGKLFTWAGSLNIKNAKYKLDDKPSTRRVTARCAAGSAGPISVICSRLRKMLGMRLAVMHNLYFYNKLTQRIRESLDAGLLCGLPGGSTAKNSVKSSDLGGLQRISKKLAYPSCKQEQNPV